MARHSFIQMSKLSNVKGRISYISDPKRQEYLYATFSTREDMTFWNDLAKECQEEFKRYGTEGKCIEARELIIALPEEYTQFDPNRVLREFTEQFKNRYDVECVSALHHNKTKKNYHIHLIFSERRLLPEPDIKIATRSVFYDELGKRVRTKKEITGEDGKIREGCTVINKGEAYECHLFTVKDDAIKNELFLEEAKHFYTTLINRHVQDPERRLKVFDPNSVYLPTKKIGKNNPKAAEIEADNAARQDWNRTADMALVSGIEESKIIEIRNEHVYDEATRSVQKHGWLPGLFRGIIQKAKEILMGLILETEVPPKPTLSVDMAEYREMQKLMVKVQDEARAVKQLMHGELPKLEKQLAETTGLFKGKERKALQEKIAGVQQEIDRRMDRLPGILKEDGYPDVQAFKRLYDEATILVEQYNRDLAAWEQQVNGKRKTKPQQKPPERESIRKKLRDLEVEAKRRNDARRQEPRPRGHDYDRGR
ncbi:MAG: MobA/MobL family protein [Clostridia bacterium]|nr:MobA/MobL family protein [Clostridia bacterium]